MKRRTILSLSLSLFLSLTLLLCACSSPKPTTTTNQPNLMDRMTAAEARLTSLENTLTSNNTAIDNANAAKSTATEALNKSKSLESSINDNQSKLSEANDTIKSLQSTISTLQNEIKELQTSVGKVQQAIATPTPTPTSNKVEALLNGNPFTGEFLYYSTIPIDGVTRSLNFTIKNNTTSTISNISLALAFIFTDPATKSPIDVPTDIDASLSTIGLSPIWAKQTGSDTTMLVFTTQSGSGILGSIYAFSQAPGDQSYTVNLTLTSNTEDTINKHYNVYPILRLISYQ